MYKRKIRILFKFICFTIIFLLLFSKISLAILCWGTKDGDPDRHSALFFTLPKNSVEVLFLGTSHVYCSYDPTLLKSETGIDSALLATSSQSFQNSYWLLKEAIRKQSPKVVVLDIHSITSSVDEQVSNFKLHYISGITILPDLSFNKPLALLDIRENSGGIGKNLTMYDAYCFWEFRNDVNRSYDFKELFHLMIHPASEYDDYGYYASDEVTPLKKIQPSISSDAYKELMETVDYIYLNKIYELTKEKGISLVLARAPFYSELDDHHLYEQAFAWAEKKEIPVVDFFTLIDETGIDLNTDFRDEDHLNDLGAAKTTHYMGQYLLQYFPN